MNDLAMLQDATPVGGFINETTRPVVKSGRRFRTLDPTGKDLEILQAIIHPSCRISGLTNKMLREHLSAKAWEHSERKNSGLQKSAAICACSEHTDLSENSQAKTGIN
ncbi:MAG: hypothetical protein K0A99_10825 [Desulfoarculaceae bacterium]|nr:hypothetical protein [Desulfoarculaceae bacterium]